MALIIYNCLHYQIRVMLKVGRKARDHFVTLNEIVMHLLDRTRILSIGLELL